MRRELTPSKVILHLSTVFSTKDSDLKALRKALMATLHFKLSSLGGCEEEDGPSLKELLETVFSNWEKKPSPKK